MSTEYEFEVDGGMNTDEVGRPVLPVGGNELCVGRDGGRFVLPLPLPGFLSKPSKSYCLIIILCMMARNVIIIPPGRGTCVGPLLGLGSTKQFDVFLAYRSKSGSKIVSLCIIFDGSRGLFDSWQVPFPRAEILISALENVFRY